jgi:hypothetical protein
MIPYRWTLPLTKGGSSLVRNAWKPSGTPNEVALYEIDARNGFDQPAKVTTTQIMRGIEGLKQQLQLSALTQAQLLNGLRHEAAGNTWNTIDDVQWRYDESARASVLKIVGKQNLQWEDDGGGAKSMTLPGGGFNPPERKGRAAEQDQTLPYSNEPGFSCHVTTVRLPDATKPRQWSFNTSFNTKILGRTYNRAFELRDRTIRMVRGSRVEELEIDAATAARDNDRIAAFDNSMAMISYDPAAEQAAPSGKTVPATYEVDWAGENMPCL